MRNKLEIDACFLQSNRECWYLIYASLDEKPQQVVATFYEVAGADCNHDPEIFMQYLDRTYRDKDQGARAASSLRTLRQRETQTFAAFLPKFEQTLADAQGGLWPDTAKITFLEGAISSRLARGLVAADLPSTYPAWVQKVETMAARLERLDRYHPAEDSARSNSRRNKEGRESLDRDGDTRMAEVRKAKKERKKMETSSDSNASEEDIRDRRECYRCGKKGHLQARCPKKKKKTLPTEKMIARAKKAPSTESTTDSQEGPSEEEEEDQGKE